MTIPFNTEDAAVSTAATLFYLYRQAGYPYGETLAGFAAWYNYNVLKPFHQFVLDSQYDPGKETPSDR